MFFYLRLRGGKMPEDMQGMGFYLFYFFFVVLKRPWIWREKHERVPKSILNAGSGKVWINRTCNWLIDWLIGWFDDLLHPTETDFASASGFKIKRWPTRIHLSVPSIYWNVKWFLTEGLESVRIYTQLSIRIYTYTYLKIYIHIWAGSNRKWLTRGLTL